ncbi:hypothetical protein JKP88DRAFT_276994 [Tribonema minus]|uniref:PROP1-like PPR domain-containing protein n=1 Tax=Tribonema minus TaxID=303371 RepID=A0A835YZG1_9STRA|nr:hypothetical protein JKP88DRAFT_276994 [Tribonema minus]
MSKLSREGRWREACALFNTVKEPTAAQVRVLLLNNAAFNFSFSQAVLALRQLRASGAATVRDYELVIIAHRYSARGALQFLAEMDRVGFGWSPIACSAALQACGIAGQLNDALQLLGKMRERGIAAGAGIFLTLIKECVRGKVSRRAGDSRGGGVRARELLRVMGEMGVVPDVRHFSAAMLVCAGVGDGTIATDIFQQMRDQGVVPDTSAWNMLLNAIGSAGDMDRMLATYQDMIATGQHPSLYTMNTMLARAGAAGQCSVAEDLWKERHRLNLWPNAVAFNTFMECYAVTGRVERAEELLQEMSAAAVAPDAATYNCLMKAYIVAGQVNAAMLIIGRMRAANIRPDRITWNQIINAADAAGDEQTADALYADARASGTLEVEQPWQPADSIKVEVEPGAPVLTRGIKQFLAHFGKAAEAFLKGLCLDLRV